MLLNQTSVSSLKKMSLNSVFPGPRKCASEKFVSSWLANIFPKKLVPFLLENVTLLNSAAPLPEK